MSEDDYISFSKHDQLLAEMEARAEKAEKEVKDLKAREDRQTGSWNTLANCADTLRARDFGTEYGAIDERVIAMAKALDASKAKCERLTAAIESLMRDLVQVGDLLMPDDIYDRLHEALYHDQFNETEKPSSLFNCQGYGLKNHSMDSRPEKPNEGQG